MNFEPKFDEFSKAQESVLASRLEALRAVVTHAGEKGRALESEVHQLLREFLPHEYGIGSGFVAYLDQDGIRLSKQLDVIIYDALRSGPLAQLSTSAVFPLEAVFGYVEVKTVITSSEATELPDYSVEQCLVDNQKLRLMRRRRYWQPAGPTEAKLVEEPESMPIRGYVFAYEARGTVAEDPALFAKRMCDYSAKVAEGVCIHGILVANKAYYASLTSSKAGGPDLYGVHYTVKHPLSTFKNELLHSLARFPRMPFHRTPSLEHYSHLPEWITVHCRS